MKRRNFLQSLTAIGIGAAIIKPTIAEEVKPIKVKPIKVKPPDPKMVKFVINGGDLEAVLPEFIITRRDLAAVVSKKPIYVIEGNCYDEGKMLER